MYYVIEKNVKKPYIMMCKRYALKARKSNSLVGKCVYKKEGNHKQF